MRSRPTPVRRVDAVAGFLERHERVLAVQRPQRGLLGGLWELPGGELRDGEAPARALARALREGMGLAVTGLEPRRNDRARLHPSPPARARLPRRRSLPDACAAPAGTHTAGCRGRRSRRCRWAGPRARRSRAWRRAPLLRSSIFGRVASRFGHLFSITTFGESHGGGVGVIVDGCPPRLRARRCRDPARSRPAPAGTELAHHAAPGGGPRRDPLGRVRGRDARHADRTARAQPGRAPERLRGHEGRVPALARRLHHRSEVRRAQLAGRRARERARDGRARRGGRDRAQAARERGRRRGARLGAARATTSRRRSIPAR